MFSFKCIFKVIIAFCVTYILYIIQSILEINVCNMQMQKRKSQKWDEQKNLVTLLKCFQRPYCVTQSAT